MPSITACTEFSLYRAYCIETIKNNEFWVDETNKFNGKTWFETRQFSVMLPISEWEKIKAYSLKECKKYDTCPKIEEVTKAIDRIYPEDQGSDSEGKSGK